MQSGKIAPVIRQFFIQTQKAKNAEDSLSQHKKDQDEPEREPTKEEALAALDFLSHQEEFEKNSLRAELRESDGYFSIIVKNSSGAQLKVLRGGDILRILDATPLGRKGRHLGRILDRRI